MRDSWMCLSVWVKIWFYYAASTLKTTPRLLADTLISALCNQRAICKGVTALSIIVKEHIIPVIIRWVSIPKVSWIRSKRKADISRNTVDNARDWSQRTPACIACPGLTTSPKWAQSQKQICQPRRKDQYRLSWDRWSRARWWWFRERHCRGDKWDRWGRTIGESIIQWSVCL